MAGDPVDRHLERVAARDAAAFRALYDTVAPKLFAIARRIVKTSEGAEDVVHDVFVKLWTGAAAYDPRLGSGMGFLATMTRNRALDLLRKRSEAALEDMPETQEMADLAPKLFAIARRIVKTSEGAEDVVHDVFVKLWTGAAAYDPRLGSGMGFLATMTRNRALDLLRKRSEAALEDMPETQEMADLAPNPETIAADRADLRAVLACLDRLAPGPRRAIMSAYLDGLTGPEVAARLSVPLGTVKTWISRGLVALKECLGR